MLISIVVSLMDGRLPVVLNRLVWYVTTPTR